jgi:hypothetical protein
MFDYLPVIEFQGVEDVLVWHERVFRSNPVCSPPSIIEREELMWVVGVVIRQVCIMRYILLSLVLVRTRRPTMRNTSSPGV